MTILKPFQDRLGVRNEDELVTQFYSTILETNRTHEFFVDWVKVKQNVESFKTEIALLGSLAGSKDPDGDLRALLRRYPEAAKAIPILIAVHDSKIKVLEDIKAAQKYADYDFAKRELSDENVESIVRFCSKTGISAMLPNLQALRDYVTGVEVGSDTNGRKNRSGQAMENILGPFLMNLADEVPSISVISQKKFSKLTDYGVKKIPSGLENRRFDFVVVGRELLVNIETNFFSGGGSKPQEIVDSYILRQQELAASGWKFILVTDGNGWKSGTNQMNKAFKELDYVLNLEFVGKGVLTNILTEN